MTVGFQLTARKVGAIKVTGKKQVFPDGNGLRLIVEPSGSKRWLLRRMRKGKDREFGLGGLSRRFAGRRAPQGGDLARRRAHAVDS